MTIEKLEQARTLLNKIGDCNNALENLSRAHTVSFILKTEHNFQDNHLSIPLDEKNELGNLAMVLYQRAIDFYKHKKANLEKEFDAL